jgi:hypothetical protein
VPATASTIRSGEYALSRSQLLYVNTKAAANNATLAAFVAFALEPAQLVAEGNAAGVALPAREIENANKVWAQAADAAGVPR